MGLFGKCVRLAATLPQGSVERRALLTMLKESADRPIGKAKYKGRIYNLMYLGETRYGYKARLQFEDGTKDFWVDGSLIEQMGKGTVSRPSSGGGSSSGKASDKQVDYALALLRRLGARGWFDSDYGQAGGPPPRRGDLEKMTSREISEFIDSLKGEF